MRRDRRRLSRDRRRSPSPQRSLFPGTGTSCHCWLAPPFDGHWITAAPTGDVIIMPLVVDRGKPQPTASRPPMPGRLPPQPAAAQTGSPAAGVQGPSPAAGLGGRTPVPVAPQPAVGAPGAVQPKPGVPTPLPAQVQQKLDQLKQNDKRRRH